MPLLLSALWLTTAGLIYNPLGAWLHDRVNSRRGMFLVGTTGCLVTTACLAAMIAEYAGTTNQVGNGFGVFFIFLYLAFQGTGTYSGYERFWERMLTLLNRPRYHHVPLGQRDLPYGDPLHWHGILLVRSIREHHHPAPNSTNWLCRSWMEVLSGCHLLVCDLHTE
jgi:hypothetical protein